MKGYPIIFTGPSIPAILADRKTQTRRVIDRVAFIGRITEFGQSDTRGYDWTFRDRRMLWHDLRHSELMARCPFGEPGTRLWVRETWASVAANGICHEADDYIVYRATDPDWSEHEGWRWRSPIHMPRWASRLTLEITDVRVERVQEISREDAKAEGIAEYKAGDHEYDNRTTVENFAVLWDSLNAKRSFGWEVNPWVWVLTFRRLTDDA